MATRTENTAVENAISRRCVDDPHSFENALYYRASLSLLRGMLHSGSLDQRDYRKACKLMAERYGFPENSILAEAA